MFKACSSRLHFKQSRTICSKAISTTVGWLLSHESLIKKMPTDMSIGKSEGGSSSVEIPSSLLTLACVQKTKYFCQHKDLLVSKQISSILTSHNLGFEISKCVCFKIEIKETKVSIFPLGFWKHSKGRWF